MYECALYIFLATAKPFVLEREKKCALFKNTNFKATVISQWNKSFEEDMKLSHKLPKWKSYILDALNLILIRVVVGVSWCVCHQI